MTAQLPVTLVTTAYNESKTIERFLGSVAQQSILPDEFIIVDGGSTDDTAERIRRLSEESPRLNVKLIQSNGRINIAQGRNLAIEQAKNDIIAVTDAGCLLDSNWLATITAPLLSDPAVDVVGGWYEAWAETAFEKRVAEAITIPVEEINPADFLPSSRSIAFRRPCWRKVGGYPEWLTLSAEDTVLDIEMRKAGCRFVFEPRAVVRWRPRANWKDVAWIHYSMGRGDGEARLFTLKYLARFLIVACPVFIALTRKKFRSFSLRYVMYAAMVVGWVRGRIKGLVSPRKYTASRVEH